mmetsp:Transcript_4583/g.6758  ORF Transcript_4583/g.6758 Transcript_4583/m.6758 type:complete len:86 (-) Transcript_4583:315-572(-)|eukprot:CAMPEP_0202449628 /NCGR_PEP_ID=MMETSP1360-20130828/8345_1 /ASSEMBLY_ACC=CAM_ASM_000848 /TAXON_ID=515479 /ORGANISM="Licmophora paradoxa, Strain CCMP2313" /LENGTH=85 /DNA_ID=CAMNT_0049067605 /DNA_START=54 /DNA_END=311 /DNA_ORIENTATION=+
MTYSFVEEFNMLCCFGGPKYEEYDWDELPAEAKEAAGKLGYNKKIWDKDKTPEGIKDKDWSDLTEEEKASAVVLGYNESSWNEGD